jgi:hypothetical protein
MSNGDRSRSKQQRAVVIGTNSNRSLFSFVRESAVVTAIALCLARASESARAIAVTTKRDRAIAGSS